MAQSQGHRPVTPVSGAHVLQGAAVRRWIALAEIVADQTRDLVDVLNVCRTQIPEPTSCSPCARPPTPSTDWAGPLMPLRWPALQPTAPSGEPEGTRVF